MGGWCGGGEMGWGWEECRVRCWMRFPAVGECGVLHLMCWRFPLSGGFGEVRGSGWKDFDVVCFGLVPFQFLQFFQGFFIRIVDIYLAIEYSS